MSRAPRPKRAATMKITSEEGNALLADEPEVKANRTRGKRRQADAVQSIASNDGDLDLSSVVLPSGPEIDKQRQELGMVFRVFDPEHKGKLDKNDIANAMRSMGKRALPAKIEAFFNHADKDGDGFVDQDEWVDYMLRKRYAKAAKGGQKKSPKKSPAKAKKPTAAKKARGAKKKDEEEKKEEEASGTTPAAVAATSAAPPPAAATASAPPPPPAAPTRSRSILEFYTPFAGMHEIPTAAVDEAKNPLGREYDLGLEGAFSGFTIALFNGIATNKEQPEMFLECPLGALRTKGFSVVCFTKEDAFIEHLPSADQAWIISGSQYTVKGIESKFISAVESFLSSGKGLAVWSDNDPYLAHANDVLQRVADMKLAGNDKGGVVLELGDATKASHFARTIITSGIVRLFEGETICHPVYLGNNASKKMLPLATGSAGHACMLYRDCTPSSGRLIVDCGFTKLYGQHWTTAGTARYVRNCAVWLLDLEHRVKLLPALPAAAPATTTSSDVTMTNADVAKSETKSSSSVINALAAELQNYGNGASVGAKVKELFEALSFKPSAVTDLVGSSGNQLRRLTDAEVSSLGDTFHRPRGPAEFFLLKRPTSLQVVVVTDGEPYVLYYPSPLGMTW